MKNESHARLLAATTVLLCCVASLRADAEEPHARTVIKQKIRLASNFYRTQLASHGGYVYHYSLDQKQRWGEGLASETQIWVQPPGTPTVGMAYLRAYGATGTAQYLEAAMKAAEAITYGQLQSGGWTNSIDFDPAGKTALYRIGKGRGKNNSSLDDGQTQSAIRFLVLTDEALGFRNKKIHEAAEVALQALLAAQFPNGGFPQVWTGPVGNQPVKKANYPDYDWRTEGRIKKYWEMYTLNDNVCGYVADALIDAYIVYGDEEYKTSLRRLGNFLLVAQMPDPQPAWAQQYNYEMQPIWARKFEPPGVSGDESQEVIETLITIYTITGDRKYLEPIPRALAYLKRSLLPDGQLARYYELETNKPLYMVRRGDHYALTYDDSKLPKHYGWKTESRLRELEAKFAELKRFPVAPPKSPPREPSEELIRHVVTSLDAEGRWVSTYAGERLVGQPKFKRGERYISSEVFSRNLTALSDYLIATQ